MRRPPARIEIRRGRKRQDVGIGRAKQMRQACLGAQERAARIHLMHQVEAFHGGFQRAAKPDCAGVVDQRVDRAEPLDRSGDSRLDLRLVANVALDRKRFAAFALDCGSSRVDRAGQRRIRLARLRRNDDVAVVE